MGRGGDAFGSGRRESLEGRITGNCAEGGKSAPQAWLVVLAVGVGVEGSGLGVSQWHSETPCLPPTHCVTLGWLPLPGLPFQ